MKTIRRKLCAILCAALLAGSLVPTANAAGVTFSDVLHGAWYYDVVTHLADSKVVNGKGNGQFDPQGNVTRAEACQVIVNIEKLFAQGAPEFPAIPTPADPAPVTTEPTEKAIEVTSQAISGFNMPRTPSTPAGPISGTAWSISDNGFGDGYLNNGKPITTENVTELLHEAEKIWYPGMTWTGTAAITGNNWYANAGTVTTNLMRQYGCTSNSACNGYAAMISDYIFSKSANAFHQVASIADIRPGDVVIMMRNGQCVHAFVAVTVSGGNWVCADGRTTAMARDGYIHGTDGNKRNKVSWPTYVTAPSSEMTTDNTWRIYSRYPV